jgi:hypothetical protein
MFLIIGLISLDLYTKVIYNIKNIGDRVMTISAHLGNSFIG